MSEEAENDALSASAIDLRIQDAVTALETTRYFRRRMRKIFSTGLSTGFWLGGLFIWLPLGFFIGWGMR